MTRSKNALIAIKLREARTLKGVSQDEAARAMGISQTTLSYWENHGGISLEAAINACEYYGVTLDAFTDRNNYLVATG